MVYRISHILGDLGSGFDTKNGFTDQHIFLNQGSEHKMFGDQGSESNKNCGPIRDQYFGKKRGHKYVKTLKFNSENVTSFPVSGVVLIHCCFQDGLHHCFIDTDFRKYARKNTLFYVGEPVGHGKTNIY